MQCTILRVNCWEGDVIEYKFVQTTTGAAMHLKTVDFRLLARFLNVDLKSRGSQ